MKISASLFLLSVSTVSAFAPLPLSNTAAVSSTARFAEIDTRAAVRQALDLSKKYGVTSPEARVAWDEVEEMRASDNSPAMMGSLDDECDVVDTPTEDCLEYGQKLDELYALLKSTAPAKSGDVKAMQDLSNVHVPSSTTQPGKNSPAIEKALKEAQDATAKFGATSVEARLAWETLEELNASGLDNAMGSALSSDECLVDAALEACTALEELQNALEG